MKLVLYCAFILNALVGFAYTQNGRKILGQEISSERSDFRLLLQDIVLNNLHPNKCVTIICDYVYYNLFKSEWFMKFDVYLSFILILVEDNEDLYAPFNETQNALLIAKNDGCQAYMIFIANGIQAARLLRFGDKYRVLDTRARFLLLYDQRLFEKNLHYLWKRIVNVIFIREFLGSKDGKRDEIPWFEISTVPFPSAITSIFVPRRLDMWRNMKFRKGVDLFRDKTSDIKNQTLKVVVFDHVPAIAKIPLPESRTVRTIVQTGENVYSGLELEILQSVSAAMNFAFELYEPEATSESDLWGKKETVGQYSGLFGEMVDGNADLALGDLYYANSILELMDLTIPYNTECLTFMTPEALTDNSWKTLILPFQPLMWLAVIICLLLCGFIFCAIARFHFHVNQLKYECMKREKELLKRRKVNLYHIPSPVKLDAKYSTMMEQYHLKKFEGQPEGLYQFGEILNSFLYTYSMLLLVSIPKLPTGWSLRVLTGWYWLYCMLVVVAYRASMTAILASPVPRVTIDTLPQLVQSKLACGGRGEINRDFFKTSLDPSSQTIGSYFDLVNNSAAALDRVANGKFAFYENVYFLKDASCKRQARLEGEGTDAANNSRAVPAESRKADRDLHIMTDCVINMPISLGLQKNSPIKPRVDKFIRRVLEAGLVKKWLDDVMQRTANAHFAAEEKSTKALMNVRKFFGALVALLIGYFVAGVAFAVELIYFHYFVKVHPDFNKYSRSIHQKNK